MTQPEDLRKYSLGLRGVTEDIKWGHDLCFCVGGKMFLVVGLDTQPVSASFKTDVDQFEELIQQPAFKPAPYLARHYWVYTDDITRMALKDWENYIQKAYNLVFAKLPGRIKLKINSPGA